MSSLIGQMLGRYKILEQLGEGGMATVYKAQDTVLERYVAIKVIRTEQFPPSMLNEMMRRFEREAKALAKLSHPNIVQVYDYGETQGAPYLVMEYLPSGSLRNRPDTPMPWKEALNLLIPIAGALAYAHERGIIHRDIKPGNILLTDKGRPMLSDFGIAKLTESQDGGTITGTGMSIGTPDYMAPEQWTGEASPQSDIYSMGAMLFELLTGKKPFQANTPVSIMLKQMNEPLPRLSQYVTDLPEGLEEATLKALDKNPQERYASMADFAATLESFLNAQTRTEGLRGRETSAGKTVLAGAGAERPAMPVPAPTHATTVKPPKGGARKINRWIPIGAAVLLLCIGSVAVTGLILRGLSGKIPLTGKGTPTSQTGGGLGDLTPQTQGAPAAEVHVLWDISHSPRTASDGTPFTPDGMYKALTQALGKQKFQVTAGDLSNLNDYDILVISEASGKSAYSTQELDSIESFVRTGGHGLLILADNPALENLADSALRRFSMSLGEISSDGPVTNMNEPFFVGIGSVKFVDGGGILQVSQPAKSVSIDQNANAVIAMCECDAGRVLAVGDTNLWDKNGLSQGDNQKFAINAFEWLAKTSP